MLDITDTISRNVDNSKTKQENTNFWMRIKLAKGEPLQHCLFAAKIQSRYIGLSISNTIFPITQLGSLCYLYSKVSTQIHAPYINTLQSCTSSLCSLSLCFEPNPVLIPTCLTLGHIVIHFHIHLL